MYESFATVWERVADAIPDAPAVVQGERRVSYREVEDRAARSGERAGGVRRGPRHQGGAVPAQLPRVHGAAVRAVEAAGGTRQRQLPLPRRRARAARRQRRRRGARVPPIAARPRRRRPRPHAERAPHRRDRRRRWGLGVRGAHPRPQAVRPRRPLGRRPPPLVHGRHHGPTEGRALAPGHVARVRPDRRLRAAGRDAGRGTRPADRRRAPLARPRHSPGVAAHHTTRPCHRGAPGQHRVRSGRHHRAARTRSHRRRHHLHHHRARTAERARDRG